MTSPSEPRTPSLYHAATFAPELAFAVWNAAIASFYLVGMIHAGNLANLLAAQAMLLVIPVAAAILTRHGPRAIGLAPPRVRFVVAALLIGTTAWYVNLRVLDLVLPHRGDAPLQQLVSRSNLAWTLLGAAVIPAICEEVAFRGVLARALVRPARPLGAIAISAVLFAGYHLSVTQAVPTAVLGALLATVAIRADSAWPAMLAHVANNAIAILIVRGELPAAAGVLEHHPTVALVACATTTCAGLALALTGPPGGRRGAQVAA